MAADRGITIRNEKTGTEVSLSKGEFEALFDFLEGWDEDISSWPEDYLVTSEQASDITGRLQLVLGITRPYTWEIELERRTKNGD
ncbi:hypothetical protein LCGC14_2469300 [marine sediment metagenome]|uniref:Uncharacterized protein n=1 Tax=marine sediment metagenome TaxID=412755 RepID=A0A0F9BYM8_9ZZZZ